MILKFSRWMAFAILSTVLLSTAVLADDESCFEQFKSSICSLNENGEKLCGEQHAQNQPYIEKLGTVFELMPPISQKLMCSLSSLSVVDDLDRQAGRYDSDSKSVKLLSDVFFDESLIEDAVYGRYLIYFDENPDLYFEWRGYKSSDRALMNSRLGELFWVLTHELGHHIEEVMSIGSAFVCLYDKPSMNPFSSPFATEIKSRLELETEKLPGSDAPLFYSWLNGSGFVSPYSLRNDSEDFAEAFTYYVIIHSTSVYFAVFENSKTLLDSRSSAFTESKAKKFATLEYLIDAYIADDDTVGLKMLTCDYLDELDIN